MSHQDRTSKMIVNYLVLKQVVDGLLPPAVFAGMKARSNASWKPRMLAAAALLWATSDLTNLRDRFEEARKIVGKIFRWNPAPGTTYQGFMKMLRKWRELLPSAILPHVRVQMRTLLPSRWEVAGYVVFAGDGSRVELARTKSLEEAFSPQRKKNRKKQNQGKRCRRRAKNSAQRKSTKRQSAESIAKKKSSPQMWLTLLWHVGTGLPWDWRTGPSDSSERGDLEAMLPKLPKSSLITADAGFVGYDFWNAIRAAGHHFVIRVGANVRLLKELGYARQHAHTVSLWPDAAAKKKRPPLVLRLIVIHDGKHAVYLVTNLTKSQLSDRQAATIYGARWGIEIFFRTFKQTFGRRKLRSRSAENASLELDWSLLALWCVCLLGQRELAAAREDPTRLSAAAALRAFHTTLRESRVRPESRDQSLWAQLRAAVLDSYSRSGSKTSRHYPRKKQRRGIRAPTITQATQQQIRAAAALKRPQPEFQLPA